MKIVFTLDSIYGKYTDCLDLPDDVNYTNEEIESMKQNRLTNWISVIETSVDE